MLRPYYDGCTAFIVHAYLYQASAYIHNRSFFLDTHNSYGGHLIELVQFSGDKATICRIYIPAKGLYFLYVHFFCHYMYLTQSLVQCFNKSDLPTIVFTRRATPYSVIIPICWIILGSYDKALLDKWSNR